MQQSAVVNHLPCSAIQRQTSWALHTVTRAETFTSAGKDPAWTRRHKLDLEIVTKVSSGVCRKNPISGNTGTEDELEDVTAETVEDEIGFGMIWPHNDLCRGKT